MTFHVGQKVVCITKRCDAPKSKAGDWPAQVVVGGVYTIRELDTRPVQYGFPMGIRLVEVIGPVEYIGAWGFWEVPFAAPCFRPALEKKTDISIFTAMLDLDSSVIGESVPQTALSPEQQKEDHTS